MTVTAQVARSALGSTSPTLCATCRSENTAEAPFCQVCGTLLGSLACPKCNHTSQTDAHHCNACGHSFRESTDICESIGAAPPAARAYAGGVSPTVLIGFGAVLSLAAAAYPWYLFGGFEVGAAHRATLSQLLEAGWEGFPGIPLSLIVISAVTPTTVSAVRNLEAVRPAVAVLSGLITLLAGVWLGQGFGQMQGGATGAAEQATGAVLVTIGAIVVITAGLHLWSVQRTETARRAVASSTSPA